MADVDDKDDGDSGGENEADGWMERERGDSTVVEADDARAAVGSVGMENEWTREGAGCWGEDDGVVGRMISEGEEDQREMAGASMEEANECLEREAVLESMPEDGAPFPSAASERS